MPDARIVDEEDDAPAARMHADEVDISSAVVRALISVQFPAWGDLPVQPVRPLGTDNALYRLGDGLVARLPRRAHNVATLAKECTWLPRLAPSLPLAVPVPVAQGHPGSGYPFPWAVYRWIEGETALSAPPADLQQAAGDLAAFIRALQCIDPTDGPQPDQDSSRGVPLARRDAASRAALRSLRDTLDIRAATTIWEEALDAPVWPGPPVWLHGDVDARNLLVRDGRLSAVIDFGCLGVGDPACDVMVAWKLFSPAAREMFRVLMAVDAATWARSRGWALSQALLILDYYTIETNPTLVREAQHWLSELVADLAMRS